MPEESPQGQPAPGGPGAAREGRREEPRDPPTPGDPGDVARDLTERFQGLIQRMNQMGQAGLGTLGGGLPNLVSQWMSVLEAGAALTSLPVSQMRALVGTIRTQRDQVRALREQLNAFEEQLTALEKSLQPMLDWGEQWVRVQETMLGRVRDVAQPDRPAPPTDQADG